MTHAAASRSTTSRPRRRRCSASAFEVAARLTTEDYEEVPIERLTCGKLVGRTTSSPVLDQVRADADELRQAMLRLSRRSPAGEQEARGESGCRRGRRSSRPSTVGPASSSARGRAAPASAGGRARPWGGPP